MLMNIVYDRYNCKELLNLQKEYKFWKIWATQDCNFSQCIQIWSSRDLIYMEYRFFIEISHIINFIYKILTDNSKISCIDYK